MLPRPAILEKVESIRSMKKEEIIRNQLILLIERQLEWGKGENWSNRDFEELSERIFNKTEKRLSVTTLKRIWGRAKSATNPSISSLNILAEFAGFDNWRSFQKENQISSTPKLEVKSAPKFNLTWAVVPLILILGIFITFLFKSGTYSSKELTPVAIENIVFDFHKVTIGYPNTVIFEYDLGELEYGKAEIQQSWDESRRMELDDSKGLLTSTYFTSGYFNTKLVIDDVVVKEKDLYIPTGGWRAFIGGNVPQVIYVPSEKITIDTSVQFNLDVLKEMNQYFPSKLYVSHLAENPMIDSRNFELETSFRVPQATDKSICQETGLVIIGTKDVLLFKFSIAGCVGDLMLYLNGDNVSGDNHDLSAFAIEPKDWTKLKVQNSNNQLTIFIEDQVIFEHTLKDDIGKIGGAQFSFEGLGEIGKLRLKDQESELDLFSLDPSL